MSNYLVTDTELTATANAIRAKTGGSNALEWKSNKGFADAVSVISGGGGAELSSIAILSPPARTAYAIGDTFDPSGLIITANYAIGEDSISDAIVDSNDLSFSPSVMAANTSAVTISYTAGGVTKTATQAVSVFNVGASLNETSWSVISQVAQAGVGEQFWNIGDCKAISLNGTVGTVALSSLTLYVFILDFNHPENGVEENNILFGGFKSSLSSGTDLAIIDSYYNTQKSDGTLCFNMNHWGSDSTYGGWKGCDFRYDILGAVDTAPLGYGGAKTSSSAGYDATADAITNPKANTLMAALPSDFRNVLRLRTHYVDSVGNKSNADANVTAVTDAISLLTEFEVFGLRIYANRYEKGHQNQMGYYAAHNFSAKYQHSKQNSGAIWWTSSQMATSNANFVHINGAGGVNNSKTSLSCGLAPVFKV